MWGTWPQLTFDLKKWPFCICTQTSLHRQLKHFNKKYINRIHSIQFFIYCKKKYWLVSLNSSILIWRKKRGYLGILFGYLVTIGPLEDLLSVDFLNSGIFSGKNIATIWEFGHHCLWWISNLVYSIWRRFFFQKIQNWQFHGIKKATFWVLAIIWNAVSEPNSTLI